MKYVSILVFESGKTYESVHGTLVLIAFSRALNMHVCYLVELDALFFA